MRFSFNSLDFNNIDSLKYLPETILLIDNSKDWYLSDYSDKSLDGIFETIRKLSPNIWTIEEDGEYLGFFWANDWVGGSGKFHSCHITSATLPKSWGRKNRLILEEISYFLFDKYNLTKIYCDVLASNRSCLRILKDCNFMEEGVIKNSTYLQGELVNHILLSKFRKDVPSG